MVILLTGPPGVGKTTMVNRVYEHYKARGLKIAGITTREVREGNQRVGFKITDLSSGEEGWLARADGGAGPRIGRYTVASDDLERIGVKALKKATLGDVGLIIVDEIGPMEMTHSGFREAISEILDEDNALVATVKYGSHYPEVERIRRNALQLEITKDNRDTILKRIIGQLNRRIENRGI